MAGNTRGKLKEQFEGIHRNFDWCMYHIQHSLLLIKDHKPELSNAIDSLGEGIKTLDELAQGIYGNL